MNRFLIRCLLFSISGILQIGCVSEYQSLKVVPGTSCAEKLLPTRISTGWYNAGIDIYKTHLSGLLLIKNMPDSSTRIVFTSEAGASLFDFGFDKLGAFKVYNILKKLNRKPVVHTLKKDFSLMLGLPFYKTHFQAWTSEAELFFGITKNKETSYFITDKVCGSLQRLEIGSRRKRKVMITTKGKGYPSPDTLNIEHLTFPFKIQLIRFDKE